MSWLDLRSLHHTASELANESQSTGPADANLGHQYQTHSMPSLGLMSGQTPKHEGLDYSLQRSAADVYSSMMPNRTHLANQALSDRRSAPDNQVYSTYDPNHSSAQTHPTLNYPNSGSSAASNPLSSQMNKTSASVASTSPSQSTWTPRHLTRVSWPRIAFALFY